MNSHQVVSLKINKKFTHVPTYLLNVIILHELQEQNKLTILKNQQRKLILATKTVNTVQKVRAETYK